MSDAVMVPREVVARIIDPPEWAEFDVCVHNQMLDGKDEESARGAVAEHSDLTPSLAKADAILKALAQPAPQEGGGRGPRRAVEAFGRDFQVATARRAETCDCGPASQLRSRDEDALRAWRAGL